ncbi:MAG: hypothetical protein K2X11_14535 [Acetobacteraceae bacterium]|nr:hypothetical protein [Acetobacteraceae bacterium]
MLYARPFYDIMVFILVDDLAHKGAAVMQFRSDLEEEVRIVGSRLGDAVRLDPETSGEGPTIPSPTQRGRLVGAMLSAPAGRQPVEVRYRLGAGAEIHALRFDVDLVAQGQCSVFVRFTEAGPTFSECRNHRPGSHGGTWPH